MYIVSELIHEPKIVSVKNILLNMHALHFYIYLIFSVFQRCQIAAQEKTMVKMSCQK